VHPAASSSASALGPGAVARGGSLLDPGSAVRRLRVASSRSSAKRTLAGLCFGVALGWAVVAQPKLAVMLLALGACLAVQAIGVRRLVLILIVTTFVTRFRIVVGGFHFMPEHVVLLIALTSLAMSMRLDRVWAVLRSPTVLLLGLFIAWGGAVSFLRAPERTSSLAIVGWLALDWLILVLVMAAIEDSSKIERVGAAAAVGAAAVAIVLWALSSAGLIAFGTQHEPFTGAQAAYGLSFEANILASTMAIWLFLILTGTRSTRFRVLALGLLGTALVLSLTRAAIIGLLLGLVVWAVLEGKVARQRVFRSLAAAAVAIAVLSVLAPSVTAPFTKKIAAATDFGSGTGQLRVQSWSTALGDIHSSGDALLGLGMNTFGQRHLDPTVPELDRGYYLGNLPLEIFYDTGLVGVLLVLAALATMRPLRREHPGRAIGLIVIYLICSITTSAFWFGSTWLLIAMALHRRHSRQPAPAPRVETRPVGALADAGLA
jgi:O-antigen ligase